MLLPIEGPVHDVDAPPTEEVEKEGPGSRKRKKKNPRSTQLNQHCAIAIGYTIVRWVSHNYFLLEKYLFINK